jgi:hypothetical protein
MSLPDPRKALDQLRKGPESKDSEPEDLPPTTTIALDIPSADGKRRYRGRWCYTVPTLGMKIDIGRLKTLYLPMGSAADAEALGIVETIAVITVCCQPIDENGKNTAAPGWFDPINARDFSPYAALYKEAMAYDRRFRGEQAPPGRRSDEEAADEAGSDAGGEDAEADARVGGDVQAPPERRTTLAASRK